MCSFYYRHHVNWLFFSCPQNADVSETKPSFVSEELTFASAACEKDSLNGSDYGSGSEGGSKSGEKRTLTETAEEHQMRLEQEAKRSRLHEVEVVTGEAVFNEITCTNWILLFFSFFLVFTFLFYAFSCVQAKRTRVMFFRSIVNYTSMRTHNTKSEVVECSVSTISKPRRTAQSKVESVSIWASRTIQILFSVTVLFRSVSLFHFPFTNSHSFHVVFFLAPFQ